MATQAWVAVAGIKTYWARPGFEPGTLSEIHTLTDQPAIDIEICQ